MTLPTAPLAPVLCALAVALLTSPAAAAAQPSASGLAHGAALRGSLTGDGALHITRAAVFWSERESDFSPLDGLTRQQLQVEARRLDEQRPSMGLGLGLTIGGGCGVGVGVVLAYAGLITAVLSGLGGLSGGRGDLGVSYVLIGLGAAVIVAGAVMLANGIVRLVAAVRERRAYGQRIDEINQRLEGGGAPPPVDPASPYAVPPPPPPAAGLGASQPSLLLATF